ncbi:MAG: 4Fe-4S ferredoxin [candidate division Zixibacteria bacterium]|nr:4Fe-4S ferredoxin [candidate division Zixibacteria bacterium]
MKSVLYFYTGTGNSLWVARLLAQELKDATLVPIVAENTHPEVTEADGVGLVFPVHIWGLPPRIVDFICRLAAPSASYCFAVAVNAGQVVRSLLQVRRLLATRGVTLSAGFSVIMPSNYIPWGGPGSREEQQLRFDQARQKIRRIAEAVGNQESLPIERGPIWQHIVFTPLNRLLVGLIPRMDRSFWVDEKCDGCLLCERICPARNIRIQNGKPSWLHRCEQCFACLQWCPQEAIQYGKKTPRYERYHHPEVTLENMLQSFRG